MQMIYSGPDPPGYSGVSDNDIVLHGGDSDAQKSFSQNPLCLPAGWGLALGLHND